MPLSRMFSFFTQIATPRSGTSRSSLHRSLSNVPECLTLHGGRALQTIVAISVTRRARHYGVVLASCSTWLTLTKPVSSLRLKMSFMKRNTLTILMYFATFVEVVHQQHVDRPSATLCKEPRVVNGPHFEARNRPESEITSPNPARHLFLKRDLGPKSKFNEWVKICTTAVYQKT